MTIEEKIYSFEEQNTSIGIGTAEPFYDVLPILKKTETPFVEPDLQKRIDPSLTKKNVKSIIAICLSYNKKFVGKRDDRLRGNLSIGAIGKDYHLLLKEKLMNIKNELNLDGEIFADTGPLVDREVAKRCGLGQAGKSGNIINKKLGSVVFIGYMLVSEKLIPTKVDEPYDLCGECDRCIKYCPTNALYDGGMHYKKCISYLTQKREINHQEENDINKQIYGCDICQQVCPYNNDVYTEYINDIEMFYPDIEKLLLIKNKEFDQTYKRQACGWRGKKILQRNAIIALSNGNYSKDAINLLKKMLKDTRDDIKRYANTAIQKLEKHNNK